MAKPSLAEFRAFVEANPPSLCLCGCGQPVVVRPHHILRGIQKCNPHHKVSVEQRFWASVTKGNDEGECWIWGGGCFVSGYGSITVGRRRVRAHRFSYEMHFGPITGGLLVCHKCDIKTCVAPHHLFLGTHADNHADRNRKGRQAKGVKNGGGTKLSEANVIAIRERCAAGESRGKLAKEFGVSRTVVSQTVSMRLWKHITSTAPN